MSDIIMLCGDDFDVLSGDDNLTLPLLAQGGKGVISVISNIAPADMAAMVLAYEQGDLAKAQALHYRMSPLVDALFIETSPVPVKAALSLMGKIEYDVRLPLYRLSEGNYEKLKASMKNYGLIS
jgi:4-hydroxy-tetrahydrodipicolinate synthase